MKHYKDAFTPVPEETMRRVEDTLRRLPRREEKAFVFRRPRWAVVIAVVLLLTLCGGAVAADRLGVLNFLFRWDGPTEEQQRLVQDVNMSQAAEMATITVTDAVFDGRQLSMGLIFDTDQPTYAMPEGLWLNGTLAPIDSIRFSWVNLEHQQRQTVTGLTAVTDETLTGQVEVRQRLMLLRPKKDIEIIDVNGEDPVGSARQAVKEGLTPIDSYTPSFANLDEPRALFPDTDTDYPWNRDALSYAAMYNLDVEEVWLTFTVSASEAYTGKIVHLDVVNNDDLPFTVVVRRAELTLVGSHFVLDVYPKSGGLERPADLDRIVQAPFSFYASEVAPLDFQGSINNHGEGGWRIDDQGQPFYRFIEETGPIRELPDTVWLVFDSRPSSISLWQWAIELQPTDKPAAQEIPAAETYGSSQHEAWPFYLFWAEAVVEDNALRCFAEMSPDITEDEFTLLWQTLAVYDLTGNSLRMGEGSMGREAADAGDDTFTITQFVELPEVLPEAVYLVPVDQDSGESNWDLAILMPVVKY